MVASFLGLSLNGASAIAEIIIAGAAVAAFLGAEAQLRVSRNNARRVRVYEYADRFNEPGWLRASGLYRDYWETHSYPEYLRLDRNLRLAQMMLPNLIEEVAFLYNRNLLDRNIAAELLGVYVERLWEVSTPFIREVRRDERQSVFSEWEEMQNDTRGRKATAVRKTERRQLLRLIALYWMPGGQIPPDPI